MTEICDTYAYFWVRGFECDPEEIGSALGLLPSRTVRKGDLISEKAEKRRAESWWELHSTLPRTERFQDAHIANLLEKLMVVKSAVINLGKRYESGISCVGYYTDCNSGFHLSAELVKRCAELGLSLDFDLYNYSGEEQENA